MFTRKSLLIILLLSIACSQATADQNEATATATFAGGCFWCMEPPFDKLEGVISTTSGYTGGQQVKPSYKQVSAGRTGHTEAVQIVFYPNKISYAKLLRVYWRNIDPTTDNAQFCDQGSQYRAEIFYHNEQQRQLAETSKENLIKDNPFDKPILTQITAATKFYPAEEYHQDYYQKNPIRYKYYRYGCGRDKFLERYWGKAK